MISDGESDSQDPISVAGIARRGQLILLMKRVPGGNVGGKWEFPGGKVDPGEDPRQALVREWQEETGLDVLVGRELGRSRFPHRKLEVELIAYEVNIPDSAGPPILVDHEEYRWVSIADLSRMDLPDSDRGLLDVVFPVSG